MQNEHSIFQGFDENNLWWRLLSNEGLLKMTNHFYQAAVVGWDVVAWFHNSTYMKFEALLGWGSVVLSLLLYCKVCKDWKIYAIDNLRDGCLWKGVWVWHPDYINFSISTSKLQDEEFLKHWSIFKFRKPMKKSQQIFPFSTPVMPVRFDSKIFSFIVVWIKDVFYP